MIRGGSLDKSVVRTSLDLAVQFRNLVIPPAADDPRLFFMELAKVLRHTFRAQLVVLWDNNVYTDRLVLLSADPHDAKGLGATAVPLGACLAGLAVERSDIADVRDLTRPSGTRQPPAPSLVDRFGVERLISLPVFSPFNQQFVCLVADLYFDGAIRPPRRANLLLVSQVIALCLDYVLYQLDHRLRSAVEQAMAGAAGMSGLFEQVYPYLERETGCLSAALFTLHPTTGELVLETSSASGPGTPQPDTQAQREWERRTQVDPELADQVIGRRSTTMVSAPSPEGETTTLMLAPIMTVSGEPLGMVRCRGPVGRGGSFSTVDMHALETLARSLGPCVERFMRIRTGSGLMNVVEQVSTKVSSAREIGAVLQQTIATTVQVLNAKVGSIYLRDSDKNDFVLRTSVGHSKDLRSEARYELGEGLTGTIGEGEVLNLKSRQELLAHPAYKGKHDRQIWGDEIAGCETLLGVPIRAEGRVIGVLKVANLRPSPGHPEPYFTDEDVETASVLSTFLGYEIENARQRELAATRYDSLTRSSVAIERAQTEDEAIYEAMVALAESGVGNAMLALYRPEKGQIEGVITSGGGWSSIVEMTKRDISGDDILAQVLREGTSVFIPDSRTDPRCAQDAVEEANLRAQYVVPLRLGDELIGTLQVDMGDSNRIEEDEERITQAFAGHLALAISRLRGIRASAQLAEETMAGSRFVVAETLSALAVHSASARVRRILEDLRTELKRPDIKRNSFLLPTMRAWEGKLQSADDDLEKALRFVAAPDSLSGPTDVHPQVQQTIDIWFNFISSSGVRIKPELAATQSTCDIPAYAFREIVAVMLVNSVQAHAKRIHIRSYNLDRVSLSPEHSVAPAFCLDFADDGDGLAVEDPEEIFGPAYTTKPTKFGTGLGLFISKRLARTEGGGDLVVEGKGLGGKGVTFRLVLQTTETPGEPDE